MFPIFLELELKMPIWTLKIYCRTSSTSVTSQKYGLKIWHAPRIFIPNKKEFSSFRRPFCTVCPGSSEPFYIVNYFIKWVTNSWTYSRNFIFIWKINENIRNDNDFRKFS